MNLYTRTSCVYIFLHTWQDKCHTTHIADVIRYTSTRIINVIPSITIQAGVYHLRHRSSSIIVWQSTDYTACHTHRAKDKLVSYYLNIQAENTSYYTHIDTDSVYFTLNTYKSRIHSIPSVYTYTYGICHPTPPNKQNTRHTIHI